MAYIKEVSYTLQSSIRVASYQYEKPTISMTAMLEEGDDHIRVFEGLKKEINREMEEIRISLEE